MSSRPLNLGRLAAELVVIFIGVTAAFFDAAGRFDPEVRARLDLLDEFAEDLRRLGTMAGELADELEATMEPA